METASLFPAPIAPRTPRTHAPAGACDCHVHVFPRAEKYPILSSCTIAPHLLPLKEYQKVMSVLGLQRAVVVQPGLLYGDDNRATLDAAQALGKNGRAVGMCSDIAKLTRPTLQTWHDAGMRGLRVNLWHDRHPDMEAHLRSVATRIAEFGWHLEFFGNIDHLKELAPALKRLPVPFVIGHFGLARVEPEHAAGDAAVLRDLMACRTGWIKLSGPYRMDSGGPPYAGFKPLVQSLIGDSLDRLVWGTNWPHLAVPGAAAGAFGTMPDDGSLLDTLLDWEVSAEAIRMILSASPELLYGFAPAAAASGAAPGIRGGDA